MNELQDRAAARSVRLNRPDPPLYVNRRLTLTEESERLVGEICFLAGPMPDVAKHKNYLRTLDDVELHARRATLMQPDPN